jgi:hypothetical protein
MHDIDTTEQKNGTENTVNHNLPKRHGCHGCVTGDFDSPVTPKRYSELLYRPDWRPTRRGVTGVTGESATIAGAGTCAHGCVCDSSPTTRDTRDAYRLVAQKSAHGARNGGLGVTADGTSTRDTPDATRDTLASWRWSA